MIVAYIYVGLQGRTPGKKQPDSIYPYFFLNISWCMDLISAEKWNITINNLCKLLFEI